MDNSLFSNAIDHLNKIVSINNFVDKEVCHVLHSTDLNMIEATLEKNRKANAIRESITRNNSLRDFDAFLAFWVYECSAMYSYDNLQQSMLFYKYDFLYRAIGKNPITNSKLLNFDEFESFLSSIKSKFSFYETKEDIALLVTAVPVEFKALFRKLSFIILVSDKVEVEKILNPLTTEEELKRRNKVWVSGLIERDNKWVKVRVILLNEYGSTSTAVGISTIEHQYVYKNEIVLTGIAGQLDETENVKIGHLVISDSYYNAYPHKYIEDVVNNDLRKISYSDTSKKMLNEDYDSDLFKWQDWKPRFLVEALPHIKDEIKESHSQKVHKGPFVSLPAVNKQNYSKKELRKNFAGALAVEMEAYGCHKFIETKSELALKIIKSVCDWSDPDKAKEWQPFCADLAAEFSVDYLIGKYGKSII